MRSLTSNSLFMTERSLSFLWAKQTVLLENIVHAETPGYHTKYVTFEEQLRQALETAGRAGQPRQAARRTLERAQWTVEEADEAVRADGNGVNISEQSVELVRNGYQLQYVMQSISSDLSRLRIAITG